jgi:glycerol-3-phosphate O-acyltransferase
VTRLAYRVMNEINRVTAVTPSALVAAALLTHGRRGITHPDLVKRCEEIANFLFAEGARFTPSAIVRTNRDTTLREGAVREACELFFRAGNLEVHQPGPIGESSTKPRPGPDATYVVPDVSRLSLDIAKNLLVHFFVTRAMLATPLVAGPLSLLQLQQQAQALSRLFKHEFQFRADATYETIFNETLDAMKATGEIEAREDGTHVLQPRGEIHARMIRSFVEGYRVAARACAALLKGPLLPKDLAKRAIGTGERMFLAGEIQAREAVTRGTIENAFLAFVDQGYLGRSDGKYVLPESYASADAVRVIEGRIAAWLPA